VDAKNEADRKRLALFQANMVGGRHRQRTAMRVCPETGVRRLGDWGIETVDQIPVEFQHAGIAIGEAGGGLPVIFHRRLDVAARLLNPSKAIVPSWASGKSLSRLCAARSASSSLPARIRAMTAF